MIRLGRIEPMLEQLLEKFRVTHILSTENGYCGNGIDAQSVD
jgi:hypothetical protein